MSRIRSLIMSGLLATGTAAVMPSLMLGQGYVVTPLVLQNGTAGTPVPTPPFIDPNLQNPWGLAGGPAGGHWWVSDESNNLTTLYDGFGCFQPFPAPNNVFPNPQVFTVQGGSPTGQVFSGNPDVFPVAGGASKFIFASETGNISAWPGPPAAGSTIVATTAGANYTGITIDVLGDVAKGINLNQFVLATNINNGGSVDIFNSTFKRAATGTFASNPFTLPASVPLPANVTALIPFNVHAIDRVVYVTYAGQNAKGKFLTGAGSGLVAVYAPDGTFLNSFGSAHFNQPYGVAQAGVFFGKYSHALLIANHGDGSVVAFDPSTLAFLGTLSDAADAPLVINGIFALEFGDDGFIPNTPCGVAGTGPATSLYFTANLNGSALTSTTGELGTITPDKTNLGQANIY